MIRKMEEPNSDTLFYSPTFKRYETINFYASLLNVLKQYTMIVDSYSPQIRRLVWTFIFQLLGQPQRSCELPFTPIINSWLDEKSIDLMDIETYFTAFTQAQFSNPNLFPNFPPIPTTFNIPGISGPNTSFRIPKSQFDLINQPSQNIPSQLVSNNSNINLKQQQSFKVSPNPKQQQQQQQQIPSIQMNKLHGNNNSNKDSKKNVNVWSTELPSVLYQFAILQSWAPTLERLSLAQKDYIWKTCRCFTNFINYDSTSFIRTFYNWSNDPLPNQLHITVMFAAIGYLKEMGILKVELVYPSTSISVFNDAPIQRSDFDFNNNANSNYANFNSYDDEDDDEDGSPNIYDSNGDLSSESDSHNHLHQQPQQNISSVQSSSNNSPYISPRLYNNTSNNNNHNGTGLFNNISGLTTLNNSLLNSKKRKSTEDINDLAVAASLSDPSTPNSPYKDDDNNNILPSVKSCLPSLANISSSISTLDSDSCSDNQTLASSPKKIKLISPEVTDNESDSNESSKSSMNINSILCS